MFALCLISADRLKGGGDTRRAEEEEGVGEGGGVGDLFEGDGRGDTTSVGLSLWPDSSPPASCCLFPVVAFDLANSGEGDRPSRALAALLWVTRRNDVVVLDAPVKLPLRGIPADEEEWRRLRALGGEEELERRIRSESARRELADALTALIERR